MRDATELREITAFLAEVPPFDELPAQTLAEVARDLTVQYFRRGSSIMAVGRDNSALYVLRSGAVDIHNDKGRLVDRGGAGTCLGSTTLVRGNPSRFDVRAIEDTLTLVMAAPDFHRISQDYPDFAIFFDAQRASRMRGAVAVLQSSDTGAAVLKTQVRDMVRRQPTIVDVADSVREAARRMTRDRSSSALVTRDGRLVGIVTDRDLRGLLADGADPGRPVTAIMTADPVVAHADALAFEVMLEMVGRDIHHMPILRTDPSPDPQTDGESGVVGVITTTDLVRLEQSNPLFLTHDVGRQRSVDGVADVARRLPHVVETMVRQDASAQDIGRIVTAIGDAIDRRLLGFAQEQLGPPPVPYCWVVLGSRARLEQGLSADQDNAILLDDAYDPTDHAAYFTELARWVTDALERCGYPRCPGDVMASNDRWRKPVRAWRRDFEGWFAQPVPDAVLQASIFFDMRPIHGDADLFTGLQGWTLANAPQSRLFLAHLARHAVSNEPPIGFFRGLVVAKEGEHKHRFDIKAGGVRAVVELARVLALAIGSAEVTTIGRIDAAVAHGELDRTRGADLKDAFEFISYTRLAHQARRVRDGRDPDDFVAPRELSQFELRHLREAFGIVARAQRALSHRYNVSFMR